MKTEDLINGYKKVVSTIYSPRNYYERVQTFLRAYKPGKNKKVRFRYCDVRAFLKSIWRLGIRGEGRFYYWKLIFWSLRRPRYLQLAVTLAIYGFHFRTMFATYGRA